MKNPEEFIATVSRMTLEGEDDGDGNVFEMTCEDARQTLGRLIQEAQEMRQGEAEGNSHSETVDDIVHFLETQIGYEREYVRKYGESDLDDGGKEYSATLDRIEQALPRITVSPVSQEPAQALASRIPEWVFDSCQPRPGETTRGMHSQLVRILDRKTPVAPEEGVSV